MDCVGPDANDDDPAVTTGDTLPQEGQTSGGFNPLIWIPIILVILVIVILVIIFFVKKGKNPLKTRDPTKNLKDAKERVAEYRKNGYTDTEIKFIFKSRGWKDSDLDKIM